MGLSDYNRKRDFKITSEPPGRPGSTATGDSFVIQKHDASRLHYDFRLELDGVLKSWSVPKGPSFDPTVKRLAVEVEDHPVDYGDFEGIIPAGEYGGGTVLLWDRGSWSPIGAAAQSLAAGQLKFELRGEKLQGRWVLVKIKERPGRRGQRLGPENRSWLLIKERDEHARPEAEWSVTEARPESVASGRGLPEIAAASDRVWHSNRDRPDPAALKGARAAPMPVSLAPACASMAKQVPRGAGWVHEVELSGERVLCTIGGGRARFTDGRGRDRTGALAALAHAARALPVHDAIVDAVATSLTSGGDTRSDRPADTLYVLDLPYLDGQDLRRAPLLERKALLHSLVQASGPAAGLRYADHLAVDGDQMFRQACQLGARGLVSKRAASTYPVGSRPTRDWRVVRCQPSTAGAGGATPSAHPRVAGPAKPGGAKRGRAKPGVAKSAAGKPRAAKSPARAGARTHGNKRKKAYRFRSRWSIDRV